LEFRDKKLFEYLGDVNFFLEKRDLQNMREVEKSYIAPAEKTPPILVSNEEKRRLQKNMQQSERKIQDLEKEIAIMENQMAAPGYFERPDIQNQTNTYHRLKKQLEQEMLAWETAVLEWEEAGISAD
jgi:ATP-binding cassette subfamily F protein 3